MAIRTKRRVGSSSRWVSNRVQLALKGELLARETACKNDVTILSYAIPHQRIFSPVGFDTVAHSAPSISLAEGSGRL